MIRQGHLNRTEAVVLTATLIGVNALFEPRPAMEHLATAGWLVPLLNVAFSSLLAYLVFATLDPAAEKGLVEQYEGVGGLLGTLLCALVALDFLALTGLILRRYGGETRTLTLNNTPIAVIELLAVAAYAYGASLGLETLARATMVYTVPLTLTLVAVFIVAAPRFRPLNLFPLLGHGLKPLFYWGAFAGLYREVWVAFFLLPYLRDRKQVLRIALSAMWLAALLITLVTASAIMFVGLPAGPRLPFPVAEIGRAARVGEFVSNLTAVFIFIFTFAVFLKLSIAFCAGVAVLAEVLHLPEYRPLIPIAALGTLMLSFVPPSLPAAIHWSDEYVRAWGSFAAYPLIVLLWLFARVKRRKGGATRG